MGAGNPLHRFWRGKLVAGAGCPILAHSARAGAPAGADLALQVCALEAQFTQ